MVPATLAVLPRVVERVAGRVPVLFDGGVRRGTDVLKAVAYGASAVLVGRPLYRLAVDGAAGLANVISICVESLRSPWDLPAAPPSRR